MPLTIEDVQRITGVTEEEAQRAWDTAREDAVSHANNDDSETESSGDK